MLQEEDNIKKNCSFPKSERLCSKKAIEELIELNSTLFVHPLKCYFQFYPITEDEFCNQIVFSVPKRYFKKAVDRNQIKRRLKEAYRLNKFELLHENTLLKQRKVKIIIVYIGKDMLSFLQLENSLKSLLLKIASHL
jgi:ribonuclease P protein component